MKPKLSIIIVNWNTKTLLRQCLNSLISNFQFSNFQTEIIIVDNNSKDGSREYLKKLSRRHSEEQSDEESHNGDPSGRNSDPQDDAVIKAIFNNRNLGFAKANNQGIKSAQGEYILLLNSDTIVREGVITKTIDWMEKNHQADIVGCRLLNPDGSKQPSVGQFPNLDQVFKMLFLDFITGGWSMQSPHKIVQVDWVMGAFMMVRKKVFDEIGGFDENIFMYMEEVELCYRAKKAGFKTYFIPTVEITHIKGGSSKSGKTGPILNIYRGLIYFYKKHKPKWQIKLVKPMLKLKAAIAWSLGLITNSYYLKKTYGQAYRLV